MQGGDFYFPFLKKKKRERRAFSALAARGTVPPDPREQPGHLLCIYTGGKAAQDLAPCP